MNYGHLLDVKRRSSGYGSHSNDKHEKLSVLHLVIVLQKHVSDYGNHYRLIIVSEQYLHGSIQKLSTCASKKTPPTIKKRKWDDKSHRTI